jgi:polyphosphate:AMP phosphotransferase
MFEALELGQSLSKEEFKSQEPRLRADLLQLQRELKQANIATLIIVAGVEGAGKGDVVNRLNKWFDSRGIETHAFWDETDEELERPDNWRFWRHLPARASIAIMFGGWYWDPIYDHADGTISDADLDEAAMLIRENERMLQVDGLKIVKLWYHLSFKMHEKRMKKRRDVTQHVRGHVGNSKSKKQYRAFLDSAERVIRHTDTGENPWQLIEADDKYFRDMSSGYTLCKQLEQRMSEHRIADRRAEIHDPVVTLDKQSVTVLDRVDLGQALTRNIYNDELRQYKARIHELSWKAYDDKRSVVIVFEGWDAAGKGGAIRRLTNAVDARLYRVISVAAPTDEERAHHYLWRFWRQVPRAGYMTLYDRSWYGRVLVERVEGFAKSYEWMRAYQEINDFEEQLTDNGTVLLKFWLHISPEEQLNRFHEREKIAWKQHKITDEDWRNREKWDEYKQAVNTMIEHTSTGDAPWTIIPADNKFFARIEVLKTVCERLEQALGER